MACQQSCVQGFRWTVYYGLVWRDRLMQFISRLYKGQNESWK
jgi:hypothetical protein